jgi:N-acetylglucosamine malate deacetylase 2
LEEITEMHISSIRPDVIVTYPVHGISGFHDHLVTHAIVKRVFCKMKAHSKNPPARLAFFTLAESDKDDGKFRLHVSAPDEIDCALPLTGADIEKGREALACYETYQKVIEEAKVLERIGNTVYFEFFMERHDPRVESVFEGLPQ